MLSFDSCSRCHSLFRFTPFTTSHHNAHTQHELTLVGLELSSCADKRDWREQRVSLIICVYLYNGDACGSVRARVSF
jgi:hypothetical protein